MTKAESEVIKHFGLTIDQINAGGSARTVSSARCVLVALLVHLDKLDTTEIGKIIGKHAHTVEYLVTRGVRMEEYKNARRNYIKAVSE